MILSETWAQLNAEIPATETSILKSGNKTMKIEKQKQLSSPIKSFSSLEKKYKDQRKKNKVLYKRFAKNYPSQGSRR